MRKIKEELQRYKQEIRDQEKARRELEASQELKRKLEEDKEQMESELAKAKQQMNEYRVSKFMIIVNALVAKKGRQLRGQCFQHLTAYSQHLRFKEAKLRKLVRYQQRALCFRLWNSLHRRLEAEREEERAEVERRQEEVRQLTAEGHRRRHLMRAAVKAIRKHARACQMER